MVERVTNCRPFVALPTGGRHVLNCRKAVGEYRTLCTSTPGARCARPMVERATNCHSCRADGGMYQVLRTSAQGANAIAERARGSKKMAAKGMSRAYGVVASSSGNQGFGSGYVYTPVYGPLTHKTPAAMLPHNRGLLAGTQPTPPQFFPGQEPVYAEMGSNSRAMYLRAARAKPDPLGKKWVPTMSSSQRTEMARTTSVGQAAYKVGLPFAAQLGTKSCSPTTANQALRRMRSSGCVVPRKVGSIYR